MKNIISAAALCVATSSAFAISEEDFAKCVKMKEFVQTVVDLANKGETREELKSRVKGEGMRTTIDFVYDFRGAISDREIVANQFDNCLKHFKSQAPKRK